MCHLQRNHDEWDGVFDFEHALEGEGVAVDVELGCRSAVACGNGASHNHDSAYFALDLGEGHQEQAEIGQRPSVDPLHLPSTPHYFEINIQETLFLEGGFGRLLDLHSAKSILTMYDLCVGELTLQIVRRTCIDVEIGSTDVV